MNDVDRHRPAAAGTHRTGACAGRPRIATAVLLAGLLAGALAVPRPALADRDRGGGARAEGPRGGGADGAPRGGAREDGSRGAPREDRSREGPRQDRHRGGPREGGAADHGHGAAPGRWTDGAHGHSHRYPAPGYAVRVPPPRSRPIYHGGIGYRWHDGVWYSPWRSGWVVVRPPYGVVVTSLPAWFTLMTIGGVSYAYANGVYYRAQPSGGYEVVPAPVAGAGAATAPAPSYVYPSQGQSAQQQASDEYECHRWAADQTGFDPAGAAVGQPGGGASGQAPGDAGTPGATAARGGVADYERARNACLEGRGYTVR